MLYFVLFYLAAVPATAHAYLDPGSGSLVFQMILAFFVSVAFIAKTNWQRIKTFTVTTLQRKKRKSNPSDKAVIDEQSAGQDKTVS